MIEIDGPKLRQIRVKRGLSRSMLAARIYRGERTIIGLENGYWDAGEILANQIANALGIDLREITRKPGAPAHMTPGAQRDRAARAARREVERIVRETMRASA